MDRICDHFLTRARLAKDQDVRLGVGDILDDLVDILHRSGTTDHAFVRSLARQTSAEFSDLGRLPFSLDRFADQLEQLIEVERLFEIPKRTCFRCFDRPVIRTVAGDHDDLGLRSDLLRALDETDAAYIRQVQIRQDHVKVILLDLLKPNTSAFGRRDFEAFRFELKGKEFESDFVVVDYKCFISHIVDESETFVSSIVPKPNTTESR